MPADMRVKRDARRFYEAALTEAERQDLPVARDLDGVQEEIAMLRLRLRTVLEERPEDLPLMLRGLDVLRRMVVTKYGLSREDDLAATEFMEETRRRLKERGEGEQHE